MRERSGEEIGVGSSRTPDVAAEVCDAIVRSSESGRREAVTYRRT